MTLAELAHRLGGEPRGDGAYDINGVAAIECAGPHELAFLTDRKFLGRLSSATAGAILLRPADATGYGGHAILVTDPQLSFARAAQILHPPAPLVPAIHPTAVVAAGARVSGTATIDAHAVIETGADIGDRVVVGAGCFIGRRAKIGAGTCLAPKVVVAAECVVGANCVLNAGAVIGSDGFGYAKDGERWVKMPQRGRVVIGDDVEIGANTTVDRGTLTDTVIEQGVKLDNLIQVAHNVRIGAHTVIAACSGIAGSTVIGRRCAIGGQVGIAGHLVIADDVQIMATSLVIGSIAQPGTYSSSLKAIPVEKWRRNVASINQLSDVVRRLRQLERKLDSLIGESLR